MLSNHSPESAQRVRHHMRWGWHGLLIFGALGTLLEIMHAWKHPAYLGVGNEMRRLMWTLAHAHGIGLSLLHIAYAATLAIMFSDLRPRLQRASRLLDASTLLMPLGFFLGGAAPYKTDPGIGVVLVPIGAVLFLTAVFFTAAELPAAIGGERSGRR
ncbi:MAG TPA: hypothetical protein VFN67_42460 [Polyangiales bacterium]|nr:hypothetical protein [Polyangiales bacterium]